MTAAGSQITILIPDPDEMMFVAGDNEANIDRIEREFAVKIVSRGAELRISGEPPQVARVGELVGAMRTLTDRDLHRVKSYYYGMISENDKYIGKILDHLRESGLAGARRAVEDERRQPIGEQHPSEQFPFAEELLLANELVDGLRAHSGGKRPGLQAPVRGAQAATGPPVHDL